MGKEGRSHIPEQPKYTVERQHENDCKLIACKVYFSLLIPCFVISLITAKDSAEHTVGSINLTE